MKRKNKKYISFHCTILFLQIIDTLIFYLSSKEPIGVRVRACLCDIKKCLHFLFS